MKIINQTYREILNTEYPIQKTSISELPDTTEIRDKSYIHLVQLLNEGSDTPKYESMKLRIDRLQNKIYEAVQNTLKTAYWDTHLDQSEGGDKTHDYNGEDASNRPAGSTFSEMLAYLKGRDAAPEEIDEKDYDGFVHHVYYDFDVLKRYIVLNDDYLQSEIDSLSDRIMKAEFAFAPNMKFFTTHRKNKTIINSNVSVNHKKNDNSTYCQMSITDGNKISNTWRCPATGNLVIYGWLDSSSCLDNNSIPSAFCVIEAKISSPTSVDGTWEIIGVQPVIPSKNITYVGFNLPVQEGLEIRARTGFTCGMKSGQYSNENDGYDTLANSTANGFKCMVYSNKDYMPKDWKETQDDNA